MLCVGPTILSENMKDSGSMYERFASGGSARVAMQGRLLKTEFSDERRFSEMLTFADVFGG